MNLIRKTEMEEYFDFIPSPSLIKKYSHIDFDLYIKCSEEFKVKQHRILSINSSQIGIDTANGMLMQTIGMDRYKKNLKNTIININSREELTIKLIDDIIRKIY